MAQTTRRDFLKKTAKAAVVAGAGLSLEEILGGCATVGLKETAPVIYPPLKGNKVQPPMNGCLIGFGEARAPIEAYTKYKHLVGEHPYLFVLQQVMATRQLVSESVKVHTVPLVQLGLLDPNLEQVLKGKNDKYLQKFAQDTSEYGKQYGGFFLSPMWEMNIEAKYEAWAWAGHPTKFKKAWKRIWQIFEDQGANEYATWAIEYHVDFPLEGYYPGDKYVDWIGLSAYNRASHHKYFGYRQLDKLIRQAYNYFRRSYPNKPIMLEEFGTTTGDDQPMWLQDAFKTIKKLSGIKAAIYWNNVNYELQDDHTLSQQSIKTLKEILKDPYWIMAK